MAETVREPWKAFVDSPAGTGNWHAFRVPWDRVTAAAEAWRQAVAGRGRLDAVARFQLAQYLPRARHAGLGQAGQLRHVYAVALVSAAGYYLAQEYYLAVFFGYSDAEVPYAGQKIRQLHQLMIMGGE